MRDKCKINRYVLQFLKEKMVLTKNSMFVGNLRYGTFYFLLKGLNTGDILKIDLSSIKEKYKGIKKERGIYFLLIDEKIEHFKLYCRDNNFNVNKILESDLNNFESKIVEIVPNITKLRVITDNDIYDFEQSPILYIQNHLNILEN